MRKSVCAAILVLASLCGVRIAAFAQPSSNGQPVPPVLQLPDGARPLRYEVALTVVPGEPKASGEIVIDVELDGAQQVLWLNADDLAISQASVDVAETR